MKQYQRSLAMLAAFAIGVASSIGLAPAASAQQSGVQPVWKNYAVQIVNKFYNPLAGGTVLPPGANSQVPINFVDYFGATNMDDGTAQNIPTGFTFDYNGNAVKAVNININGWVSLIDSATFAGVNGVPIGYNPIPVTPANNNNLFSNVLPFNTVAPFWGDHYYRTNEPGYTPSQISYSSTFVPDPNPNSIHFPFDRIWTFEVEWKNLNINDKYNPGSVASFQLFIRQNPLANDKGAADQRATIEFQYGPIGTGNVTVVTQGAAVGAKDSVGDTHINALFVSAADLNDVANNTMARTSAWPPTPGSLPGRAIDLVPADRSLLNTWGDGDVFLLQLNSRDQNVRTHQSLFVTVADAMAILQSAANAVPLDSIEGGAAFHGDANHNGRGYHDAQGVFHQDQFDPRYDAFFYFTTPYDASYLLMYLAGKLSTLPWPYTLPVPVYKAADIHTTDISGVVADASNVSVTGSTVLVPITVRGAVNGPLSIQMDLKGLEASGLQFVGTRAPEGTLMCSNVTLGRVTLAASGQFSDGQTVGYLELRAPANTNAEFDLENVRVNDVDVPSSHIALKLGGTDATVTSSSDLEQNVPNPFIVSTSGETTIGFDLAQPESVTLRVFDVLGQEVRTLVNGEGRAAGHNTIQWDGRDNSGSVVASGAYYYQIVTPDFTQGVKMQVVR